MAVTVEVVREVVGAVGARAVRAVVAMGAMAGAWAVAAKERVRVEETAAAVPAAVGVAAGAMARVGPVWVEVEEREVEERAGAKGVEMVEVAMAAAREEVVRAGGRAGAMMKSS